MSPTKDERDGYVTYLLFDKLQLFIIIYSLTQMGRHEQSSEKSGPNCRRFCGCFRSFQAVL